MATIEVRSPAEGYEGNVVGVVFADGVAEVNTANASALAYFRRHGYTVGGRGGAGTAPATVDPRDVAGETVGTPLRDAAVDPQPGDFLAPVNAGDANPHGPAVVAPEIHGSHTVRPVLPGPVSSDPAVQEARELAHLVDHVQPAGTDTASAPEAPQDGPAGPQAPETLAAPQAPAGNASKADWVAHAIALGVDPDVAGAAKRDELADAHAAGLLGPDWTGA